MGRRFRLTGPAPAGIPTSCTTRETPTTLLCRFEVIVRDNGQGNTGSADFFSIRLSTSTVGPYTEFPDETVFYDSGWRGGRRQHHHRLTTSIVALCRLVAHDAPGYGTARLAQAAVTAGSKTGLDRPWKVRGDPIQLTSELSDALDHLRRAVEMSEEFRTSARTDSDLDPIRNEPAFKQFTQ